MYKYFDILDKYFYEFGLKKKEMVVEGLEDLNSALDENKSTNNITYSKR